MTALRFTPVLELPRRRLFAFTAAGDLGATGRIRGALAAAARWRDPEPPAVLVDLELAEVADPTVVAALTAHGHRLDAILVRVPTYAADAPQPALDRLVERGVVVVIRDLDVRGADLGLLAGAPIDIVELPAARVRDVHRDGLAARAVRERIDLAHCHDWLTLATDVRDRDQLEALAALGCDLATGPAVGPSMGGDETARTVARLTAAG